MEKGIVSQSVILILKVHFLLCFAWECTQKHVSEHSCGCFIILVLKLVDGYMSLCHVLLCVRSMRLLKFFKKKEKGR